jgi:hypothetical protein
MNRRALLRSLGVVGVSGLAGCSSPLLGASSGLPAIESKEVTIDRSRCGSAGERNPHASISYDRSEARLTVDGVTATPSDCTDLLIRPIKGIGRANIPDDVYWIVIDLESAGACNRCPAETSYSATIDFAHNPAAVSIYHTEEVGDDLRPLGPYATKAIR